MYTCRIHKPRWLHRTGNVLCKTYDANCLIQIMVPLTNTQPHYGVEIHCTLVEFIWCMAAETEEMHPCVGSQINSEDKKCWHAF